jgi:hypothetical protein
MWPLFNGGGEGIMQRFLGQVEVAEQANQRGKDATRLRAVDLLDDITHRNRITKTRRPCLARRRTVRVFVLFRDFVPPLPCFRASV